MTNIEQQVMSRRLKAALKFRSMTQRDLAEKVGITESAISRYITGTRLPKMHIAFKICDALGVSLDWYVNGYCKRCKRNQDVSCETCKYLGEG